MVITSEVRGSAAGAGGAPEGAGPRGSPGLDVPAGRGGSLAGPAGSRAGEAKTLDEAKRAVEETVLSLASQLSLFGDVDGS